MRDLSSENSIANVFLSELRSVDIQKDSMRFRRNLERLGEIMAYEISRQLTYVDKNIETPLGNKHVSIPVEQPVLAAVLRAGLPFHQGFLNYFDKAPCAFIGAQRSAYDADGHFEIVSSYIATPDLRDKVLILTDPMLATGKSMEKCFNLLNDFGPAKEIHIASVIASRQGIEYVKRTLPEAKLWVVGIDEELSSHSYIIPGLGDAGDLSFGDKI
jgi:uracil phosphoribosyltransferase